MQTRTLEEHGTEAHSGDMTSDGKSGAKSETKAYTLSRRKVKSITHWTKYTKSTPKSKAGGSNVYRGRGEQRE